MRVVVAMSGGVDSSVAAALLVEAGHEVIGLSLKTHAAVAGGRGCCTPQDLRDARAVADHLDIPCYVMDLQAEFSAAVVRPFAAAYVAGHTPNPCVQCNDRIKFRPLWHRAAELGAERLATGHYARLVHSGGSRGDAGGTVRLRRAADRAKDQSYFLHRVDAAHLRRAMFPVGGLTKAAVRAIARQHGLPVADKAESQELCFVGQGGYAETVAQVAGAPPAGDIRGPDGAVLGRHAGIHRFTLGQRRGLGVAAAEPLYVVAIDAASHTVQLGRRAALAAQQVVVEDMRWAGEAPPDGAAVAVQLRHRGTPHAAELAHLPHGRAQLRLAHAVARPAPGQAAVIYDDDIVLGGGSVAAAAAAA